MVTRVPNPISMVNTNPSTKICTSKAKNEIFVTSVMRFVAPPKIKARPAQYSEICSIHNSAFRLEKGSFHLFISTSSTVPIVISTINDALVINPSITMCKVRRVANILSSDLFFLPWSERKKEPFFAQQKIQVKRGKDR